MKLNVGPGVEEKKRIRVAVVGCGAIARAMHIPAVLAETGVSLVGLVDPELERAKEVAREFGVSQVAGGLEELQGEMDAVILATPPHVRCRLAEEAFAMGVDVLAEKPLANSATECARMIKAAARSGRILAGAHVFRFYPPRVGIERLIRGKSLGELRRITITEGRPYSWPAATGYTVRRDLVPGGVLFNAGIHSLDTILWWLSQPECFEYWDDAVGGLESNVRMILRYAGGLEVRYRASRTCLLPAVMEGEFERGRVRLSLNNTTTYEVEDESGKRQVVCQEGEWSHSDCEREQLRDFIRAVRERRPARVPGEEAAKVVALVEECYRIKRNRPVPIRAPIPGKTW